MGDNKKTKGNVVQSVSHATRDWSQFLERDLQAAFPGVQFTTYWDVTADIMGAYVTRRTDLKRITKTQRLYIQAWMAGREACL